MEAALFIQVKQDRLNLRYEVPILTELKAQFPDLVILDLDNFSDLTLLHYANQVVANSQRLALLLEDEPDSPLGRAAQVLENFLKKVPENRIMLINGVNKTIIPLARTAQADFGTEIGKWVMVLEKFFGGDEKR